jgi:hypothetical protein
MHREVRAYVKVLGRKRNKVAAMQEYPRVALKIKHMYNQYIKSLLKSK